MLSAYGNGLTPAIPPRGITTTTKANGLGTKKEESVAHGNVRESVAILFLIGISVCCLFSAVIVFKYALRDRTVYEELVDYLDKTVSISKINYNPVLGVYELKPSELEGLDEHRKYKSLIWAFLFADLACLLFFGISAFFYFSVETSRGIIRVLFWLFLFIGLLYALSEVSLFTFLLSPFIAKLPNATIALLDHAIPYNPGGLAQMEKQFGCIFDQNLYETFKRHMNPRNTCDPYLLSSFIPRFLLFAFIALRLITIFAFMALAAAPQSAISVALANCILRVKPAIRYKKNADASFGNKLPAYYSSAKTTFGVKENVPISSPLPNSTHIPPSTPPLGHLDHRINYNNAAFFAVSGANVNYALNCNNNIANGIGGGGGSSRSSEISIAKCNLAGTDLATKKQLSLSHLGSTHTTNSLVSEV